MKQKNERYYQKMVSLYSKAIVKDKFNKKLTLSEQKKVLDFISAKISEMPININITWRKYRAFFSMRPPQWCSGYSKASKMWMLFIPKPTTVHNVAICLHELGHIKFNHLHYNIDCSYTISQTYHEHFADIYSYNVSKYLGFKWNTKMWHYRKCNAKCYNVKEASKINYKNFYIKSLYAI